MSSLLAILPASLAQTKPAVPTFTIEEIYNPYDVPPTYTTDPYTGETILTNSGYHVENKTTYIKIENQPFTQYIVNDSTIDLRRYYLPILKLSVHCINDSKNVLLKHRYRSNSPTKYALYH